SRVLIAELCRHRERGNMAKIQLGIVPFIQPGNQPGFSVRSHPGKTFGGQSMPSKLYVGNLAYSVSGSDLEALFSQAGAVQSSTVITDKISGQSKGFGFVEMATAEDAATAIQR